MDRINAQIDSYFSTFSSKFSIPLDKITSYSSKFDWYSQDEDIIYIDLTKTSRQTQNKNFTRFTERFLNKKRSIVIILLKNWDTDRKEQMQEYFSILEALNVQTVYLKLPKSKAPGLITIDLRRNNNNDLFTIWRSQMRKNKTYTVIEDILKYVIKRKLKSLENELNIIATRFNQLESRSRKGVLSFSEELIERSKISDSLLQLIDKLET